MRNLEITCAEFDDEYLELEDNCNFSSKKAQVFVSFNKVNRSGVDCEGGVTLEKEGAEKIVKYLTQFFKLEG